MEPKNFRFGGGVPDTVLGPTVLVAMLMTIGLIFLLPRKYVIVPMMLNIFLCPVVQTLVIGGFHIFVVRILLLAGWIRLLATKRGNASICSGGYNTIDKILTIWAIGRALAPILLFWQMGAVVYQTGIMLDTFAAYFLARWLIQDTEDVDRVIKTFAVIAMVLSVTMLYERKTGMNVFGLMGGMPIIPDVRDGAFRAQGPFAHAILAGCFGAVLFPLFFWLWKGKKSRLLGVGGMAAASIIPFSTVCSTPVMAYGGGLFAVCFWPLRKRMRWVRWGIVVGLIALQLVMKVPFWWAIQHVDVAGGSSSWHRALLVDQFITHVDDWWLLGTRDNASWGHHTWDVANQYVAEGEIGGMLAFVCFLGIIRAGFVRIGKARKCVEGNVKREWFLWCLGGTLFAHVMAYFGISYFDWSRIGWLIFLAMISAATHSVLTPNGRRRRILDATTSTASVDAPEVLEPSIAMQIA